MEIIVDDLDFIKSILPAHYSVEADSMVAGSIRCKSSIGIVHKVDADDDEHWDYIVAAIKKQFGQRFLEIDHKTNFCHVDFTIHLRSIN